ncbi:MAG: GTP-binding protein [Verrucomicrobiales bacterium]|jgi:GTP-binding protein
MPIPIKAKPTVAIVGRPNVGKSALFNRFAGRRISIVHDQPGVTRDRIAADCNLGPTPFEVVDTGGIGAALDDGFGDAVRAEADIAIQAADLILLLVDAHEGINPIDADLANVLRRAKVETILVVNKVDDPKHDNLVTDFAALGFDQPIPLSAEHGRNFEQLLAHISDNLIEKFGKSQVEDEEEDEIAPACIAIVGRPNVGKSSLINAVLQDERTIVSSVSGTTRDAIDVPYERGGQHYTLIDTAGIRKRGSRDSPVEIFSVMRSERSIRRADLCLLVVDAGEGVTKMDRTIAQLIQKENKPCIIIANKFDLFEPESSQRERLEKLREHIERELFFLHYAPIAAVSAMKGENLNRIFGSIERVGKAANEPLGTGQLNRVLRDSIASNPPPAKGGKRLNLLYVTTRRSDRPRAIEAPRILLFVNHANLMTRTYERYLENKLRAEYDLTGLPIDFQTRARRPGDKRKGQ